MKLPQNRLRPCLSLTPLIGVALGVAIGFVLTYHSPSTDGAIGSYPDLLRDAALNLVEFLFGILGVAVAVVVYEREIYCVGRRKHRSGSLGKKIFSIGINFVILIGAIQLIDALHFLPAMTILAIGSAALIGEVGWSDPFALMHVLKE